MRQKRVGAFVTAVVPERFGEHIRRPPLWCFVSLHHGTLARETAAVLFLVCRGKGQGSIVFYAFPQEVVDQIVERTGGRPITVAIPEMVDGEIEIDPEGRVFLVDRVAEPGGESTERYVFLMQVTNDGRILMDYRENEKPVVRERIHPFAVQPGRSEVRNGKIVFPETQQRPYVPPAKTYR